MKSHNQIIRTKNNRCFSTLAFCNFTNAPALLDTNGGRLQGFFNSTLSYLISLSLALFMLVITTRNVQAAPFELFSSEKWEYCKGDRDPGPDWKFPDFDASSWEIGSGGFGYGKNNTDQVKLNDMRGRYQCVYSRCKINVNKEDKIESILLHIDTPGPYVAYLNGVKICQNSCRSTGPTDITDFAIELLTRENDVLCVQGFNDDIESDTFSFRAWLEIKNKDQQQDQQ